MCIAVPGILTSVEQIALGIAVGTVDVEGAVRRVRLDLVPDAAVGEYVLIHTGLAVGRVDREEAERVMDALRQVAEASPEGSEPS